jgi:hypothetical protein
MPLLIVSGYATGLQHKIMVAAVWPLRGTAPAPVMAMLLLTALTFVTVKRLLTA